MHNETLETHEHTEHLMHHTDSFVARVAILVAVLAVMAAVTGNLEALESESVLQGTSEATLEQDKATDAWAEYQANSIKRHLYLFEAEEKPANAAKYRKAADDEQAKQTEARSRAEEAEKARNTILAKGHAHETRHHRLTASATLFEIAIALGTVALVTRKSWLLLGGVALGAGGLVFLAAAFI